MRLKALELKTQVSCFKGMGSSEGRSGGRGFRLPTPDDGGDAGCHCVHKWPKCNLWVRVVKQWIFLLERLKHWPYSDFAFCLSTRSFVYQSMIYPVVTCCCVFSSHPMNGSGCSSFVSYYWFIGCCLLFFLSFVVVLHSMLWLFYFGEC